MSIIKKYLVDGELYNSLSDVAETKKVMISKTQPTQANVWRITDGLQGVRYMGSNNDAMVKQSDSMDYYSTKAACDEEWSDVSPTAALPIVKFATIWHPSRTAVVTNVTTETWAVVFSGVNALLKADYQNAVPLLVKPSSSESYTHDIGGLYFDYDKYPSDTYLRLNSSSGTVPVYYFYAMYCNTDKEITVVDLYHESDSPIVHKVYKCTVYGTDYYYQGLHEDGEGTRWMTWDEMVAAGWSDEPFAVTYTAYRSQGYDHPNVYTVYDSGTKSLFDSSGNSIPYDDSKTYTFVNAYMQNGTVNTNFIYSIVKSSEGNVSLKLDKNPLYPSITATSISYVEYKA